MNITKYIFIVLTLITLSISSAIVWAQITRTLLVLDMLNVIELPKNFRTTSDPLPVIKGIKWDGMTHLHMAGSGQFSELALKKILQRLNVRRITIIDLRQEPHGFLNGNAISWYGPQNATNAGKTSEQIENNQTHRLDRLADWDVVTVHQILKKTSDAVVAKTKSIEFPVRRVASEMELAQHFHVNYQRIYVEDFHAPIASEVDRFIQIANKLSPHEWIYFHCRAGVGRTTTFMAMVDMMRSAKQVSFHDILARQAAIGGKDFDETPDPDKWKYKFAVERLNFLKKFYEYAHDNNDNFQTPFSATNSQFTNFQKFST